MYPQKVVVLFSGGLDSSVVLAELLAQPVEQVERVHALILDYEQTSYAEIEKAEQLCQWWRVPYTIQKVPPDLLGKHTDTHLEVPARNLLFVSIATTFAANLKFNTVALGAEPDSTYTDSTVAFINKAHNLLGHFGISLITPVKHLTNKVAMVQRALDLGVPLWLCHSSLSNTVDGQCKTSQLFLDALEQVFPNHFLPPKIVLQELTTLRKTYDHHTNVMYLQYEAGTFKYPAALFTILGHPLFNQQDTTIQVYSTGSWMNDLYSVWTRSDINTPAQLVCHKTNDLLKILHQPINCDSMWAQWGLKQALAPLPRARYLKAVACRQFQGHLARALTELGYMVESPAYRCGMLLETEPR